MSKILIQNYRGFDIEFDSNYEKFQCEVEDGKAKESPSFSAMKKFIDDFKKTNQDFKPFWVEKNPESYLSGKTMKVIGIRKDGRFVAEDEKGNKEQLSDHNLKDYMLKKSENEEGIQKLQELRNKEQQQSFENAQAKKSIIASLKIVTLEDYKKSLE